MDLELLTIAKRCNWHWQWAEQRDGEWYHCFEYQPVCQEGYMTPEVEAQRAIRIAPLSTWKKTFEGVDGYVVS